MNALDVPNIKPLNKPKQNQNADFAIRKLTFARGGHDSTRGAALLQAPKRGKGSGKGEAWGSRLPRSDRAQNTIPRNNASHPGPWLQLNRNNSVGQQQQNQNGMNKLVAINQFQHMVNMMSNMRQQQQQQNQHQHQTWKRVEPSLQERWHRQQPWQKSNLKHQHQHSPGQNSSPQKVPRWQRHLVGWPAKVDFGDGATWEPASVQQQQQQQEQDGILGFGSSASASTSSASACAPLIIGMPSRHGLPKKWKKSERWLRKKQREQHKFFAAGLEQAEVPTRAHKHFSDTFCNFYK